MSEDQPSSQSPTTTTYPTLRWKKNKRATAPSPIIVFIETNGSRRRSLWLCLKYTTCGSVLGEHRTQNDMITVGSPNPGQPRAGVLFWETQESDKWCWVRSDVGDHLKGTTGTSHQSTLSLIHSTKTDGAWRCQWARMNLLRWSKLSAHFVFIKVWKDWKSRVSAG